MRSRSAKARRWTWKLTIPVACVAVAAQLALAGSASATHTGAAAHHMAGTIAPSKVNTLDCNGWSAKYRAANPGMKALCTDPLGRYNGRTTRFYDNGHYVGHDEPSVKFISSVKGSGNTMTYAMRLPRDPKKAPTVTGSVTDYEELSIAPWFGLPICDPKSYPQNPCKPDSDSNTGVNSPTDAGSAFMELQFYPPGWAPFTDFGSCSVTRYCSALNIDSVECTFNNVKCNNNCIEPVNFAFMQTNGVPTGPPAPQDPNSATFLGSSKTLKMNPGDVLKVSISDPLSGLLVKVQDLTTGQSGFMQASAKNGFANTNMSDCSGTPHTFHAEYSTAKKQNEVPWAALEGGVLMEQEIGHFEACSSLAHKFDFAAHFSDGTSYVDPNVSETCNGGAEGASAKGEGPCNTTTGACQNSTTEGSTGPVACPDSNFLTSTAHCEFADGLCAPKGTRAVTINGKAAKETFRQTGCFQNLFQNGDVDFDGTSYQPDWPNGSSNFPETFRYTGPFSNGHAYRQVQYETDGTASEQHCNITTGVGCTVPPGGANFYPFWSINQKQTINRVAGAGVCIWNFGNDIAGVTKSDFGKDKQYGKPDVALFGGTIISKVLPNPTLAKDCKPV